ncbi:O-methyltransferase [Paenibacillus sp. NPDC056579]|uniref:O-methyltransferase n=1 Tax=unclassified Paenibacillus TaxID=185978 RepID=UPI001EF8F10D|nr:O-methyltransferase [Paenibacillus sp. H1-7]ULL18123.1 O-methyltransferase [Paenibacillus sp. H1-7]
MHPTTWEKVDRYIEERLIPYDPVLEKALAANQQASLPPYDVTPGQGKLLHLFARMMGARRILEIGTLGGYSTIWLARALPQDGVLITLELEELHARVARANIASAQLEDKVDVRIGSALDQLAMLEAEGVEPFDLIFIDADKPNNPGYLQWALKLSRPGTVIIGDNVIREGEVTNKLTQDARVQGVQRFFELMSEESRIEATAIQTVGSKGYDGFSLGIVTG